MFYIQPVTRAASFTLFAIAVMVACNDGYASDSISAANELKEDIKTELNNRLSYLQQTLKNKKNYYELTPLSQGFFDRADTIADTLLKLYKNGAEMKIARSIKTNVARLFSYVSNIDNNLKLYLKDPNNAKESKKVLNELIIKCKKLEQDFTQLSVQIANNGGNNTLNQVVTSFETITNLLYENTQEMMNTIKKPTLFKRIFGK
jgi:hypothetical protein